MARRLIIAPSAFSDLMAIAEYIELDSAYTARRVVRAIFTSIDNAKLFPRMGRVVPEFSDDRLRELIVHRYRVIYRLHENDSVIQLLRVIHGARDLKTALGDRPI